MTHPGGNPKRQNATNNLNGKNNQEVLSQDPAPPDGGWGWVVVFASFMIHIATDGVTYSFGVFYVEFLNFYHSGKGETAWILSILVGITYCSGPIASAFVNKYGCRAVTIAGSILASFSLIISVFAPNILTLYVTIGLGAGFGFGLIYLPAIVCVTVYFEKYRSLATGIAVCGSGFGTFLFAPFIGYLTETYTWKPAMVITGSLILLCIIFGLMFRPLPEPEPQTMSVEIQKLGDIMDEVDDEKNQLFEVPRIQKDNIDIQMPNVDFNNETSLHRPRSLVQFATSKTKLNTESSHSAKTTQITQLPNGYSKLSQTVRLAVSQPMLNKISHTHPDTHKRRSLLQRKDIFYQGSLYNIPQYRSSRQDLRKSSEEIRLVRNDEKPTTNSISEDVTTPTSPSCNAMCSNETRETIGELLNLSLFRDLIFVMFAISNFLTSIGFNVPYVYIKATAEKMNIPPSDANYLISIIGIANTIARIILGYLSDKPWVNRLIVYNTCLTINGIATFLSAFCYDFFSLAVYASVYGFTIGAYVGLTSVILVDLLGLDKLTNAFGLLLLFQGIASLIGPPIAGFLYDVLDSYGPGFMVAGVAIALSGMMLYTIPTLQKHLAKNNNNNNKRYNSIKSVSV